MVIQVDDEGFFQFEDCLLKHYVRKHGWLPLCKHRLATLRKTQSKKHPRRLRYFTFCAIGAIDVLMLDVAKVISQSDAKRFDTVFFFEKTRELVEETRKRIPGAIGFPGDFVDIVLADNGNDANVQDILDAPADENDDALTRRRQILLATQRDFIRSFPFDVINLDLERFLYWPTEERPGRLVNALRQIFAWQRRPPFLSSSPV